MKYLKLQIQLITYVLLFCSALQAETNRLHFSFPASFEPISGVGFLMSSSGTKTIYPIEVASKEGIVVAGFSVDKKDLPADAMASVAVFSSEGQIEVSKIQSTSRITLPKLPQCPAKQNVQVEPQSQLGVLQSLVSIRTARRDTARQKIDQLLTPALLERLIKLEKGLGLTSEPPLSSALPALALRDRLHHLLQAVKNYRSASKK
jgi:hypothetical protein